MFDVMATPEAPRPLLRGLKVTLRIPPAEDDIRFLHRVSNNPEAVGQFVNFEPINWETFQQSTRFWSAPPNYFTPIVIVRNEDQERIGAACFFVPYPSNPACLELGGLIEDPKLRGKGYITEALQLTLEFLFLTKPIVRVQATTGPGNVAIQRLLERAGFAREGVLRQSYFVNGAFDDRVMYALLRDEWSRARPSRTL